MLKNKCIEFKNNANGQELYFYGDIVSNEDLKETYSDTCPKDIQDILSQIDETKPLDIYINSCGGSVTAGIAIYNMLKRCKSFKTVYIDALAGSIASVIAMAGDSIIMPSNAYLMIHKPLCDISGNSTDIRKMAVGLDTIEQGILNIYAEKLAKDCTIETIKQMMADETWIVGSEANKYFDVTVIEANKAVASVSNLDCFSKVPNRFKNEIVTDTEQEYCVCDSCNHSDNCQSAGCKCCICANCTIIDECSKPGATGCKCCDCPMAQTNCCQPNSSSCLCNSCSNVDCMKGHVDTDEHMQTTDVVETPMKDMPINKTNDIAVLKAKLELELTM